MSRRGRWLLVALGAAAIVAAASGCSTIRYYSQAIHGHLEVMQRASPIAGYLEDARTAPALRDRLKLALEIREFASRTLALPDNSSYRKYADLGRPYVIWNVVAAEEFSVRPKESCFPVAGCVAYRGYYGEADANRRGDEQRAAGLDVFVYGVAAYSTLGWFADPLLNTFIHYPEPELARLVFHELAHQVVYIRDDTVFNESFAVAVEEEGVRRWIAARGAPAQSESYRVGRARRAEFVALVLRYQARLGELYARGDLDAAAKRAEKARTFAAMRAEYDALKASWGGWAGYDRWFAQGLNNAHLASVSTYTQLVPAFDAILAKAGGDMRKFYEEVKAIGALPKAEREARLRMIAR